MIPKGASMGSYDAKAVSDACSSPGGGESMTQQHFADDADINTIVRRFGLTGQLPHSVSDGVYADFSGITDYDSALETIERTEARFMRLPAELRDTFRNDPAELVRFAVEHTEAELVEYFGRPQAVIEPPVVPDQVSAVLPAPAVVVAG